MPIEAATPVSIGKELDLFIQHIDSLSETLPLTMLVIQEVGKKHIEILRKYESEHGNVHTEGTKTIVRMPIEHYQKWKRLRQRGDKIKHSRTLVPRSLLVSLVSEYDAFLGKLLRTIFILKPELLNSSEKNLSFVQIKDYPSIEAVRDFVIEKEVEGVLRASHADQFKWMENRFDMQLRKGLVRWGQFIELAERRNLYVHADGIISSQYLTVCKQHAVVLDESTCEGVKLEVTQNYFQESYQCIFELATKLAHVLWRKLFSEDRQRADENLLSVTYDLVDRREYALACGLLDFACETLKEHCSEWAALVLTVNRAQAYKWNGKSDRAAEIMARVDWSAKGDEFKLAAAVLAENWAQAATIMKRIGANGSVEKINYRDWPLFKEFRKQSEFATAYNGIFGESFSTSVTSSSNQKETEKIENAKYGKVSTASLGTRDGNNAEE